MTGSNESRRLKWDHMKRLMPRYMCIMFSFPSHHHTPCGFIKQGMVQQTLWIQINCDWCIWSFWHFLFDWLEMIEHLSKISSVVIVIISQWGFCKISMTLEHPLVGNICTSHVLHLNKDFQTHSTVYSSVLMPLNFQTVTHSFTKLCSFSFTDLCVLSMSSWQDREDETEKQKRVNTVTHWDTSWERVNIFVRYHQQRWKEIMSVCVSGFTSWDIRMVDSVLENLSRQFCRVYHKQTTSPLKRSKHSLQHYKILHK